ncbi:MAG: hypothetical protein JKY15_00865 [Deltaproteobacteria bacterium]|nr:hypothetical protein [Deltaproteobacteria bacterium]
MRILKTVMPAKAPELSCQRRLASSPMFRPILDASLRWHDKWFCLFLLFSFNLFAAQISFMDEVNRRSHNLMQQIYTNDFVVELKNGTLPQVKFGYFKNQDKIYTYRYSKILAELSNKSPNINIKNFLMKGAYDSSQEWQGPLPSNLAQCPDCSAYSNFEQTSVEDSFKKGLAAIAPCYIVYWDVAQRLAQGVSKTNPYYAWIERYANPHYKGEVEHLEQLLNEIALASSYEEREDMIQFYLRSVRYEYLFWMSAYNMATWETTKNVQ